MKRAIMIVASLLLVTSAFALAPSKYREVTMEKTDFTTKPVELGNCVFSTTKITRDTGEDSFGTTKYFGCNEPIYARCYYAHPMGYYNPDKWTSTLNVHGTEYVRYYPSDGPGDMMEMQHIVLRGPDVREFAEAKGWWDMLCNPAINPKSFDAKVTLEVRAVYDQGMRKEYFLKIVGKDEVEIEEQKFKKVEFLPVAKGSFILKVGGKGGVLKLR